MGIGIKAENKKEAEMEKEKMRVVYVEPGQLARTMELTHELGEMQKAVGGDIEVYSPFDDACIVCNEEGKINGMEYNRAIYDENGEMIEAIFGPFFICDGSGEDFGSLTDEQLKRYEQKFRFPERLMQRNGRLYAIPYKPRTADLSGKEKEER